MWGNTIDCGIGLQKIYIAMSPILRNYDLISEICSQTLWTDVYVE